MAEHVSTMPEFGARRRVYAILRRLRWGCGMTGKNGPETAKREPVPLSEILEVELKWARLSTRGA